jgi:hypothetical protein
VIYEALEPNVFGSIKYIEMAHEVWKRLEEWYESTSTIKDAKIYIF